MHRNVGIPDQIARIVVGTALLFLVLVLDGPSRWVGLIGLVPLATGAFGFCPLYAILGLSTCHVSKEA